MYLVLTYFDAKYGPKVVLSFPDMIPDNIKSTITELFDVEVENQFFEFILSEENLKFTNL